MEDVWEWEGEWGGSDESKRGLKVKERECKMRQERREVYKNELGKDGETGR